MSEKFPYGYDVNAYIDKAFEQMKADFPSWALRKWKANISTSPITPGMMER